MDDDGAEGVLITGVYGSGKSSLAAEIDWVLERRGESKALLDLDYLGWAGTAASDRASGVTLMLANLTAVAENYRRAGIRKFVLAWFLRGADDLRRVREAVGLPLRVVRLDLPLAQIEQRLAGDVTSGRRDDLRDAAASIAAGTGTGIEDLTIANDRPIGVIAREVMAFLGWPSGLPPEATPASADASVFLETDRLVLRRFTMDDADELVSLDSDPEVMHFITGGVTTSREEIEQDLLPYFLEFYELSGGYGFWAAIEKSTGDFLGWFHFRPKEDDGDPAEAELGYRLRKSAWGKGYATEASKALIRKGFADFGVQRVFAQTMAVNMASRRVMEKAGLTLVRSFHQPWPYEIDGHEHGDVEYALTRAEWEAQATAPRS